MSDQVETPVNLQRNEWVRRVLKIDFRAKKIRGVIVKETKLADPGIARDDNTKSRTALMRRLGDLKTEAINFSAIAPRRNYVAIREQIQAIQGKLSNGEWEEAHKLITAVFTEIQKTAPDCRKLSDLRNNIQRVTLKLDKLYGILLTDDFFTLDKELLALEQGVNILALDSGIKKLAEIEKKLDQLKLDGELRLGRIKILQKQMSVAEAETTRLGVRAGELALTELQNHADALAKRLNQLASSDDEKALNEALTDAKKLREECSEPFAKAETERRQRLLEDIRERMDQTLLDHRPLIDGVVTGLDEGVIEAKNDLTERLKATPVSDQVVEQAEFAFDDLVSAIDTLQGEMDRIGVRQQQMKPRLEKCAPIRKKRIDEDEAKDDLDSAYDALPAEIRKTDGSGWAKTELWAHEEDWEPWVFLKAWAKRLKQNADEANREAYQDALARKPGVCNPYNQIARKASPTHHQTGEDLLTQINQLLQDAQQSVMLQPQEATALDKLFDQMVELVKEMKEHIANKRDEAKQIDDADGGHSVRRHGPDVTDSQLQSRLKTGRAPDGVFSPAAKSCRFNSYDDLLFTRQCAFAEAAGQVTLSVKDLFGEDFDQAPDPVNGRAARRRNQHSVAMDHLRAIGSGFIGKDVAQTFQSGGQCFSTFDPLPSLTKTFTKIVWDESKSLWVVAQHFPTDV